MAAKLTPMVMRRIAGECTDVDVRGTVGIRLEPAAAIDENQDGTRGSNLLCSANEFAATACPAACRKRAGAPLQILKFSTRRPERLLVSQAARRTTGADLWVGGRRLGAPRARVAC